MSKVNANVVQSLAPERVQVGNWLQHLLQTKKYARKNVFGTWGKNKKPGPDFFPCAGKARKFNAAWQNDQEKCGPTFVRASRARRDFFQTRLRGVLSAVSFSSEFDTGSFSRRLGELISPEILEPFGR